MSGGDREAEPETYLVLARSGVCRVRDLSVGVLRVVALEVLICELETRLHVGVAGVEE